MYRRTLFLPPILVVLTFLLDTAVLPVFTGHWLLPAFALLTVHTLGLLLGRTTGTLYGMLAGLAVDVSLSTPLGLMTLFYTGLGYLGGWFGRMMRRNPLAPVVSALVCFAIFELGMIGYATVSSAAFSLNLLTHGLIRIALEVGLIEAFYILYDWLIKPSRSRYARR